MDNDSNDPLLPIPVEPSELEAIPLASIVVRVREWLEEDHSLGECQEAAARLQAIKVYVEARQGVVQDLRELEELIVRNKRRIGQLLQDMPRNPGARKSRSPGPRAARERPVKLEDTGLSRRQAIDAQKLAAIPDEPFEAAVQNGLEAGRVTTAQVIRETSPPAEPKRPPQGMDLCPTCDGSGYVHKDRAPRVAKPAAKPAKVERSGGSINEPCDGKSHPMFQRSKGVCLGCGQTIGGKK